MSELVERVIGAECGHRAGEVAGMSELVERVIGAECGHRAGEVAA